MAVDEVADAHVRAAQASRQRTQEDPVDDAELKALYREIWDDPAARQKRRTTLAAILVLALIVLVILQWVTGQTADPLQGVGVQPPLPASLLPSSAPIEVLPPGR